MLQNALRICEAKFGMLHRYSDGTFVAQAMVGAPRALVDALLHKSFTPPPGVPLDRMLRTKKVVHTLDAAAEEKPNRRPNRALEGTLRYSNASTRLTVNFRVGKVRTCSVQTPTRLA